MSAIASASEGSLVAVRVEPSTPTSTPDIAGQTLLHEAPSTSTSSIASADATSSSLSTPPTVRTPARPAGRRKASKSASAEAVPPAAPTAEAADGPQTPPQPVRASVATTANENRKDSLPVLTAPARPPLPALAMAATPAPKRDLLDPVRRNKLERKILEQMRKHIGWTGSFRDPALETEFRLQYSRYAVGALLLASIWIFVIGVIMLVGPRRPSPPFRRRTAGSLTTGRPGAPVWFRACGDARARRRTRRWT